MNKKELAESLAEVSNKCANNLKFNYNFEVDLQGDNPAVIENTVGVGIEVFEGPIKSILDSSGAAMDTIQYRGVTLSFCPGNRWEPPSTDIESTDDILMVFNQAVEYLITKCVEREVVDYLDYLSMDPDD